MYLINCMAGSMFVGFFFLQYSFAWITAKARQIQQMCMQQYFHWISWPKEDRILYLNAKGSSMCVYTFTYIYIYVLHIYIYTHRTRIYIWVQKLWSQKSTLSYCTEPNFIVFLSMPILFACIYAHILWRLSCQSTLCILSPIKLILISKH